MMPMMESSGPPQGLRRPNIGEFVPAMPGGGVREFRPGQEFIPGGGMGLAANAGEFVPGGGIGGVREFRPGQEFIPGGGMALATNAGEFVPSFVAQQMGAGREFVPGHQFIPGGMDGGYDGQGSMMQAIPDDDVGDYGDDGAVYDENGEYVDGNEYADDEEEGWMEITATVIGSGTPHPDNAVVYAAFDSAEELIWSGSASGRLSSHWVQFEEPNPEEYLDNQPPSLPTLRVVTQVRVFKDCPVRHILAVNDGVLALGDHSVRIYSRGCVPLATISVPEDAQGLMCMDLVPQTASLVCGGRLPHLTGIDLNTLAVTRVTNMQAGVSCIKATNRHLICGSLDGQISLHDPRTSAVVHALSAHAGPVTALDIREHLLVTCGMNIFRGQATTEPAIKVFDVRRTPRPMAQIPFFPGPLLLKYNPKFSCTLFAATETGTFQMCDVGGLMTMPASYQVANSVTAMDVSSSGELVSFGDHEGGLFLWSDKGAMQAALSKAILAAPPKGLGHQSSLRSPTSPSFEPPHPPSHVTVNAPAVSMGTSIPERHAPPLGERWEEDKPLSACPFPQQAEGTLLLSDWPRMTVRGVKAPLVLDRAFLATVNQGKDFVGYAQNPGFKRGQTHKGVTWLRKSRPSAAEEVGPDDGEHRGVGDGVVEKKSVRRDKKWRSLDPRYQLQEIRLGKLGIEDFPFKQYNSTPFGGLENTIPNSYTNAWIHTMLFNWPLRTRVLNYLSAKEVSLTDELGFLFHMLANARGNCCQATNFLRAFSQLPEASRLELLDQTMATAFVPREGSDKELLRRVQNLNRFVLEQMNKEMAGRDGQSAIDLVFGANMCRKEMPVASGSEAVGGGGGAEDSVSSSSSSSSMQESREFQWRLTYPKQVLQNSLSSEQTTRAWSATTKSYKPTKVRRAMVTAPNVLCIDSGLETPYAEGASLFRNANPFTASSFAMRRISDADKSDEWLPLKMCLEFVEDKACFHVHRSGDATDSLPSSRRESLFAFASSAADKDNADKDKMNNIFEYELIAVISCVFGGNEKDWNDGDAEDGRHLITHVRVRPEDLQDTGAIYDPTWMLVNDFLLEPVSADEVVRFQEWRTPAVIYYARTDLEEICPGIPLSNPITRNVYKNDRSLGNPILANKTPTFVPPSTEELATAMTVGIDAEFVALTAEETELRLDGTNLVTKTSRRVSVVRAFDSKATVGVKGAEQRLAGTPMIDDYIKTPEQVMDYLTRFSGLVPGDLDPSTSPHHLIPLKRAYVKLRYLVDKGYTFVGHGLSNDFRIINIWVPPEQVKDTVEIYHFPNRRKISLRFLAKECLGQNIQTEIHDSIEDARTALLLYQHHLQCLAEGRWEQELERIYDAGQASGWQVPDVQHNLR